MPQLGKRNIIDKYTWILSLNGLLQCTKSKWEAAWVQ